MTPGAEKIASCTPLLFLLIWFLTIIGLIGKFDDINLIARGLIVLGIIPMIWNILSGTNQLLFISPLLLAGMITLMFYSVVPATYAMIFPEPISYFPTLSARMAHYRATSYVGSAGELLILQFSSFCLLILSMCLRGWAKQQAIPIVRQTMRNPSGLFLMALHLAVLLNASLFAAGKWVSYGQTFFATGIGIEIHHALAPLMSVLFIMLSYFSAKHPTGLKYLGPFTIAIGMAAMIASGLAATAIFMFLIANVLFFLEIKVAHRKLLALICAFGVAVPVLILATMIPRGEFNEIKSGAAAIEYSSIKLISKIVIRQTTSGHCLNGIYETAQSAESKNPFFFAGAIIPRIFWPQKPRLSRGAEYAEKYCGQTGAIKLSHSESITLLGEPLLNGGVLGVVVAQLLVGSILYIFTVLIRSGNLKYLIFTIALLPWLSTFEQHFAEYFANLVKVTIIMLPFYFLLTYMRRRLQKT